MPLKSRYVKAYRKFININYKLVNSQAVYYLYQTKKVIIVAVCLVNMAGEENI